MSWFRQGDYQLSPCGRYLLHRTELHHGYSYALYDCDPPTDWPPITLLAVKDTADKCRRIVDGAESQPNELRP